MPHHDDFASEPMKGLPEMPPPGERVLWQGRPDAAALALEVFNLKWVAGYFVLLALWRLIAAIDLMPLGAAIAASLPFLVLGAVVCLVFYGVAWVLARATVYTITTSRVALRIGAALTVTLNMPYSRIANVDMVTGPRGTGTLALEPLGDLPVSFLVCWPHTRPWHFARPQPALRCIPEVHKIAALLSEAAETRVATPTITRTGTAPSAVAAE